MIAQLPIIEEWQILDRKTVAETGNGNLLVWWLVSDETALGSTWHPFIVAPDEKTIIQAPAWAPLPGAQYNALSCPVFESLWAGNRGSGKSEMLLLDYSKEIDRGYGDAWRGILFRQQLGDLDEMVRKAESLFTRLYGSRFRFLYSKSDYRCVWDTGEELLFRHLMNVEEYNEYHGHQYPWIGFEELTQWSDDKPYRKMFSCCRPTAQGVPTRVRANCNPSGVGHGWIKKRFRLPKGYGKIIRLPGEEPRVAIKLDLKENFILLHTDPGYINRIRASASSPGEGKAWADGDWDVTFGGMFDDLWNADVHVVPDIKPSSIPRGWKLSRSYDHGQSKPFATLWWAESNGEPFYLPDGRMIGQVRGDLLLFKEWYGTNGEENTGIRMLATKIAQGILDRENDWGVRYRVNPGPAGVDIWTKDSRGTQRAPIDDFEAVLGADCWEKADVTSGSRKSGYQKIREMLGGAKPGADGTRESPGLFVCAGCTYWLDLCPTATRDPKDQDDTPKNYEDHLLDACFTADTEVLTESGWKAWPCVSADDIFATMSLESGLLEYQKSDEIVDMPWNGDIVMLRNKTQLAVTPNHRMVVKERKNKYAKLTVKRADDLNIWDKIVTAPVGWRGRDSLELPFDCADEVMAELLGWWVAEGWLRSLTTRSPFQRDVGVSQKKADGRLRLDYLLSKTPWSWSYRNCSYITTNKKLYEFLRDGYTNSGDKHVPDCVKKASPQIIEAFLRGYIAGDGWVQHGARISATVSRLLADDLQELYLKTGRASSIIVRKAAPYFIEGRFGTNTRDQFWVIEHKTTHALLRDSKNKPNFERAHYEGRVYCAQVPNGTLVVRRNGRVSVTGNTRYRVVWSHSFMGQGHF